MYVLIVIFIVVTFLIGVFSATLVAREVVIEEKERRKNKNKSAAACEDEATPDAAIEAAPETKVAIEPLKTATLEEIAITEAEPNESAVTFSTATQTLDEKYLELSAEYKGYYDEIVRYAMSVENSKRYKNSAYEEYKVGKNRLVRLKIKRGVIVCELVIPNLTFKNYISDNKVSVKQAPATIKVVDEAAFSAVKDSIGIAVKAIEEEKAYKKEQAKIRRRENRKAAKNLA